MSWLVLTTMGILIDLILEKYSQNEKKVHRLFSVTGLLSVIAIIYYFWGQMKSPGEVYEVIDWGVQSFNQSFVAQVIAVILIEILIVYFNKNIDNDYTFEEYSQKIQEFTKRSPEGSKISLSAGDMDFLGDVSNDDIEVQNNIENNKEYKQLYKLKNEISKIRILCNNKLKIQEKEAIIKGTISAKEYYRENRLSNSLTSESFQQLLRIGKMKCDFDYRIDFRFYNSEDEDKRFRGRFIESGNNIEGIVYKKENNLKNKKENQIYKAFRKLLGAFTRNQNNFLPQQNDRYSVQYLKKEEIEYYKDMFEMKWDACNKKESQIITDFCERLYRFAKSSDKLFKMALIYVNSYEIARKKRRKEFPPFGVLYLAAVVEEEGWEIEIFPIDENNYSLSLEKFDVVGFSIVSSYSYKFLKLCCDTSKMRRDVVKIAGGYQAEKFSDRVFRDFKTDVIFRGEGEESIREFVNNFKYRNYGDIKGIIYKPRNGRPIQTSDREDCVDLDKIPFPARHLLDQEDIVMTNRLSNKDIPMIHMLFSRGCPQNCYYCAANHDGNNCKIRYRAKEKIVEELLEMKSRYKIKGFSIIDDCFLTNQNEAIKIINYLIERKINLEWSLAARVDQINEDILNVLKKAGCIEIKYGIETGSDELLKKMNKGTTVETAKKAIKMTKQKGISVKVFIITGLPGENKKTHDETKDFLREMKPYIDRISLLRFTPLAGSYIYSNPNKFGINSNMLKIDNFDKMRLYRKSANWWIKSDQFMECEKWYKDMQEFININWEEQAETED